MRQNKPLSWDFLQNLKTLSTFFTSSKSLKSLFKFKQSHLSQTSVAPPSHHCVQRAGPFYVINLKTAFYIDSLVIWKINIGHKKALKFQINKREPKIKFVVVLFMTFFETDIMPKWQLTCKNIEKKILYVSLKLWKLQAAQAVIINI